ncbi:MAG: hypothetical protein WD002_14770 [Pseudomonadales bacterium]
MESLVDKIVALHGVLKKAGLPHAFGGALALAWCTQRARGTIDIDVNVLIPTDEFERALDAMPERVKITRKDRQLLKKEGQVRIWWDKTPIDLFLNSTDFHDGIEDRIRWEQFGGDTLPFLSCLDLAVFKAFFNRSKDWVDLEEMKIAGTLDVERTLAVLIKYLGVDDERVERLRALTV